jgi:predicted lipid-binding transport protein (Tim44 family)
LAEKLMASSQLLDIVLIAMVAGVILFRLYTVLGRRTGQEREPSQRFGQIGGAARKPAPGDNVVALPDRSAARLEAPKPADPLARALLDIQLADRNFEAGHFLAGARHAYEIIVSAFAAGDRSALRPLLSDDVYTTFDAAIRAREARNEKIAFTFVGFKDAKIVHAALKERMAEITVQFAAQFNSSTTNAAGAVVDGDPKALRDVSENWTFSRDTRASDPNWILVATGEPEAH